MHSLKVGQRVLVRVSIVLMIFQIAPVADAQLIVAHRGAAYDAPENTLAAFNLAWEKGADAIEGDFYLTKDGHIVAIHDKTTRRTAGVERAVAATTLDALQRLDVGAWKSSRFRGQRIPTLREVLATVPAGKKILIEIKCGPEIVPPLREILTASALKSEQMVVICFDQEVIAASKRLMPQIKAYWLTDFKRNKLTGKWTPTLKQVLDTLQQIRADGLDSQANSSVVNSDFVSGLRAAGREFHVWTVNDPLESARFQRLGVDSITTDRPAYLRSSLPSGNLRQHVQLYLPLDGDLHDASRFKRKPRWAGDRRRGQPAFVQGVFGKALDLQASAAAIAIPYQLPDSGSLCLWSYVRPWYDYQTIFDNSADENAWEMWIYASGLLRFRSDPRGTTLSHRFHPTADVNEWHHLAICWDRHDNSDAALRLFVDGHLAQQAGWKTQRWVPPGSTTYLGGGHTGNDRGNGLCDELLVFDKPLSQADVRAIMFLGGP